MINIKLDEKKRLGILSGDLFDEIREHFSVKNEAARFARRFSRFIPQRTYAITPTGRFEPCMFFEIKRFLANNQYPQTLDIDPAFFCEVVPANCEWHKDPNFALKPYTLSLPLRDYQSKIVIKAVTLGR